MLILEILTLLVCIVTFAPLSNAASNAFIFTIVLTALLLLLIPLILTFISGFKGDKAEHERKRDKERQAAVVSGNLVLETDPIRRKQYLRLPKLLVLAVCPGAFLLSFLVLYFTKNHQDQLAVLMLRQPFMALAAASIFAVIPLLMYWANCSGTSLVQRVYLSENRLCYTGYSGSMDERVEFAFVLLRLGKLFCWKALHPYPGNIYPEDKGRLRYASEKRLFQDAPTSPHLSGGAGTDLAGFFKKGGGESRFF